MTPTRVTITNVKNIDDFTIFMSIMQNVVIKYSVLSPINILGYRDEKFMYFNEGYLCIIDHGMDIVGVDEYG